MLLMQINKMSRCVVYHNIIYYEQDDRYHNIASLNFRNSSPCSGFAKKVASILSAEQYSTLTVSLLTCRLGGKCCSCDYHLITTCELFLLGSFYTEID